MIEIAPTEKDADKAVLEERLGGRRPAAVASAVWAGEICGSRLISLGSTFSSSAETGVINEKVVAYFTERATFNNR